jgi:transcriptional regulator with XRE-family HTH domain
MDMGKRNYSYIRINRRLWGLTQEELATLVGLSGAAAVSRIEQAKQAPSAQALIGYCIVFGLSAADLLPNFHRDIEETVAMGARILISEFSERTDKRSQRIRLLLEDLLMRLTRSD